MSQQSKRPFHAVGKEIVDSQSSLKIEEWLNTEEAARYLGLSVGSLRNMASNGQIPYYKLGRRNRYHLPQLREFLLSNRRGGFNGN